MRRARGGSKRAHAAGQPLADGIAVPVWADLASISQRAKEGPDVIGQQFRLLERGEMAAARHLGPALDIEGALAPLPGRPADLLGEGGHGRWYDDALALLQGPRMA